MDLTYKRATMDDVEILTETRIEVLQLFPQKQLQRGVLSIKNMDS